MTEIYLHFLVSHYGLYANAPVSRAPSPLPLDTSLLVARIGRIGLDAGGKPRKTGSGLGRPSSLLLLLVSLSVLSLLRPGLRQALPVASVTLDLDRGVARALVGNRTGEPPGVDGLIHPRRRRRACRLGSVLSYGLFPDNR